MKQRARSWEVLGAGRLALLAAVFALGACAEASAPAASGEATARDDRGGTAASDVAALRARALEASGYSSKALGQGVQLTGSTTMLGASHEAQVLVGPGGDFLMDVRGPLAISRCATRGTAWMRDIGGETRMLHLGERDEAVLQALFVSGAWVDDARLTLAAGTAPGSIAFTLVDSPVRGTVMLDAESGRVSRAEWRAGEAAKADVMEFSGVVSYQGVNFPGVVRATSANGSVTTTTFTQAQAAPTFIRSPYAPVTGFDDVRFDGTEPTTLELKRAKTGHLLCRPLVNGKQFDWFFFDTGAGGTILTPEVIDALGLERFGQVPVSGIGEGMMSSFVRAESLEVGPVTMTGALATEIDLSFVANAIGEKVSGIVGFNLLSRCIAEIDQKGGVVKLHDPAVFLASEDAKGLTWLRLVTYERHPCVEASFEGHTGFFKLDTGAAGSTVSIHAPAVTRLKLLDGRETRDTRIGGVGGMRSAKKGMLAWFELGGVRTENVEATFATEQAGAFDDPYTLGNIGDDLMEPFVLVLDYQRERIAFWRR